uniref:ATP synthase complex subunit 8 n=1 Tax=Perlesta teaysia TaxID=2570576 RepID=A0A890CII8_9NEOP|nr:ATP synthase F0 subunit 8 [Perlesta teaysia]QRG31753.1 ATP synthase F0 subunit 8 [Perlesta teaysia]
MPQMAPISWLTLFIAFSLILLLFNFMNYFSFLPQAPFHQKIAISNSPLNWKW